MQKLSKLDLEPNEIYNVSFNIKQGNKNIDTLRFFQTQVPKLFNIKPSNFNTFSQINESATSVTSKVTNSGIIPGGTSSPVGVKSVIWTSQRFATSREDGVTAYEPEGFEYTFEITFDSAPDFTSYYLSGFTGFLDFLNYRTDYKTGMNKEKEKTLTLTLSLADIDPSAERQYTEGTTTPLQASIVDAIKKGSTTVYLPSSTNLNNITAGRSKVIAYGSVTPAGSTVVWMNAPIIGIGKFTDDKNRKLVYVTLGKEALADKSEGTNIAIYGLNTNLTYTGDFYAFLKTKGENTSSNATVKNANIVWQTSTRYDASKASTDYTFKKSSSITSSLINPNIIEKLIWEDEVRDYIYFIISDTDNKGGDKKKYFFGTYGSIDTLATEDSSLEGTKTFNPSSPPSVTDNPQVISSSLKRFPTSTGKVDYYKASEKQTNNQNVPPLLRTVQIRFAIARYTKNNGVWSGYWLPGKTKNPEEILSGVEELD